jgi:hypothetical protein
LVPESGQGTPHGEQNLLHQIGVVMGVVGVPPRGAGQHGSMLSDDTLRQCVSARIALSGVHDSGCRALKDILNSPSRRPFTTSPGTTV